MIKLAPSCLPINTYIIAVTCMYLCVCVVCVVCVAQFGEEMSWQHGVAYGRWCLTQTRQTHSLWLATTSLRSAAADLSPSLEVCVVYSVDTHTHTHTQTHTIHNYKHAYIWTHTCMHTYTVTRAHTHAQIHIHIHMQYITCLHSHMCTCTHI